MGAKTYKGFIETLLEDIRIAIDDPNVGARFDDDTIMRNARNSARSVFLDMQRVSKRPLVHQLDLTLAVGTTRYLLPPCIGSVLGWGAWNTTTNSWDWKVTPTSRIGFGGRPGIFVQGNEIVTDCALTASLNLRVEYKPSGDFVMHAGSRTFSSSTLTPTQFALVEAADETTNITYGEIDHRQNALVGGLLRVWSPASTPVQVQEQTILSYAISGTSGKTRLVTVGSAWNPAITQNGTTSYSYEVVPIMSDSVRMAVMLKTAIALANLSGMSDRSRSLLYEYRSSIRTARLSEVNANLDDQLFNKVYR